jgi:hypothetical protein
MAADVLAQHHRAVVLLVASAVDERHRAVSGAARELHEQGARRADPQLRVAPPRELAKPIGIVPEPAAQVRAGREVLRPQVDAQGLLLDPAGPEPVDEHAVPVAPLGRLVSTLDPNHRRSSVDLDASGELRAGRSPYASPGHSVTCGA